MFRSFTALIGLASLFGGIVLAVWLGFIVPPAEDFAGAVHWATYAMVAVAACYGFLGFHAWTHEEVPLLLIFFGTGFFLAMAGAYVAMEGVDLTVTPQETMRLAWSLVSMAGLGLIVASRVRRVPFPETR